MWGGRFDEATDTRVETFCASVDVDKRMATEDIRASIAHAEMLAEREILTDAEARLIKEGLRGVLDDIQHDRFEWRLELEDVHMNIERALIDRIGPTGGKLHTARSRNDQVATDLRLWLRAATQRITALLRAVRTTLVDVAKEHLGVIMPGYTHLQVAQPILFSHHLLAYYEMFTRDQDRYEGWLRRADVSPLGAGALAGTGFPIDRHRSAALLGFSDVASNSLDAVSDRDFSLEFLAHCSIAMVHLSRLSEELILWSSQEFGFVTLPESHTTGSSIMPQKQNPDVCELIRGKTGRVCGHLMGHLMMMKGLPLAYNKDMQEDKEGVFDASDTLCGSLELYVMMLPKMRVRAARMKAAAGAAFSNATDLADYLAKKGMPFREAHEVVGKLVGLCAKEQKALQELELARMQAESSLIAADVYEALSLEQTIEARNSYGGTARAQVERQLARAREALGDLSRG